MPKNDQYASQRQREVGDNPRVSPGNSKQKSQGSVSQETHKANAAPTKQAKGSRWVLGG